MKSIHLNLVFVFKIWIILLSMIHNIQQFGHATTTISPSSMLSASPSSSKTPSVAPSTTIPTYLPSLMPTHDPSAQPTLQPSGQPSGMPSSQPSVQPSRKPTMQPSILPSSAPLTQPSRHPSSGPTCQPSCRPSIQPSLQPVAYPSTQPSSFPTCPTAQPSQKPSSQPSGQPSSSPTIEPSVQPSFQPTRQPSVHPSALPTIDPSMQPTSKPSSLPSLDPSRQPSNSPTTQPSVIPTNQPSAQPSTQPSNQPSSTPTDQPSVQPSMQPSRQPSVQPSSIPTMQPSAQPSMQPSSQPSTQPTMQPSSIPTQQPSMQPSGQPSQQPSTQPSAQPSMQPSSQPSGQPSSQPSVQPSTQPTGQPLCQPSTQPSMQPSNQPSTQPSSLPTNQPSTQPSTQPTSIPTIQPSFQPSTQPSSQPSSQPSTQPSMQPSGIPSMQPSAQPSMQPSTIPSRHPSVQPSCQPSVEPTSQPSMQPSSQPSKQPSLQPSTVPSNQPSSQPTSPTAQPSRVPSNQPSRQPSFQPSSSPTSRPSPLPPCPIGTNYNLTGHTTVVDGVAFGYYTCIDCPPGSFNDQPQSPSCNLCPPGSFASTSRSSFCTLCPLNYYAVNNGTTDCTKCGKFYVNGLLGSKLKSDCVNPTINFVSGSIAFIASFFAIGIYLLFGRLHRVAFERKHRLIRKNMMMYGALITTADIITKVGGILDSILHDENAHTFCQQLNTKIMKPFIIFPILFLIIVPLVVATNVLHSLLRIAFNAMVLWRAYKLSLDISFVSFLDPFLNELNAFFRQAKFFRIIAYPVIELFSQISNIQLNLKAVEVTCPGAQSPLFLLLNLMIVGVVVVVIESDIQVLWMTMLLPALGKVRGLLLNRYYIYRNFISTLFFLMVAVLVAQLPDPGKLVQYCMGFIVISGFFDSTGRHWVPYSENCDGVLGFSIGNERLTLPLDTVLGNCSALLAVLMLPAVIYILAEVLFALNGNRKRDSSGRLLALTRSSSTSPPGAAHHQQALLPFYSRLPWTVSIPGYMLGDFIADEDREDDDDSGKKHGEDMAREEEVKGEVAEVKQGDDEASIIATAMGDIDTIIEHKADDNGSNGSISGDDLPTIPLPASNDIELVDTAAGIGRELVITKSPLEEWLRSFFTLFAFDWLTMKVLYNIGKNMFARQRQFLLKPIFVTAPYRHDPHDPHLRHVDVDVEALSHYVKIHENAYKYDPRLKMLQRFVKLVKLPVLPWFDGYVSPDTHESVNDYHYENSEWKKVEKVVPNYRAMVGEARDDIKVLVGELLPWSELWLCWLFPAQILLSKSGRSHWYRVAKTFVGLVLASLGIWPKWLVEDFKIAEKFRDYNRLSRLVYQRVGQELFEQRISDTFTKIDNNRRLAFGLFVQALITCRIALVQLVPILTIWSMLSSSVASTPLFVLSEEMDDMLPRMFALYPFTRARQMLEMDMSEEPWRLQVWFLGLYIWMNQSRLVIFFINAYQSVVAISILFFPAYLNRLVPFLVVILVQQGFLSAVYITLILRKLMFPKSMMKTDASGKGKIQTGAANAEGKRQEDGREERKRDSGDRTPSGRAASFQQHRRRPPSGAFSLNLSTAVDDDTIEEKSSNDEKKDREEKNNEKSDVLEGGDAGSGSPFVLSVGSPRIHNSSWHRDIASDNDRWYSPQSSPNSRNPLVSARPMSQSLVL